MNKALHVFVYLFLILAGAALWFELQLNAKRTSLTARNRQQEDYLVMLARTVEKEEAPNKDAVIELKLDDSPVEARLVDTPEMKNLLEEYKPYLETQNIDTFSWDGKREQLRHIYVTDEEGNPLMDGNMPIDKGPGTSRELLEILFNASKDQQTRLNNTRAELPKLRAILEQVVDEVNRLKPIARQDKVTIVEKEEKIAKLEGEKVDLQNQITTIKAQIEELNGEITSLRDEKQTALDEVAEKAELLEAAEKRCQNLQKILRETALQTRGSASETGAAVSSVPFGDKGRVLEVDNQNMFAIVEFSPDAMKELKGNNPNAPLPALEFSVKRRSAGYDDIFVGRIKLRQEITGKNYVICDVLSSWSQTDMRADDVVFAD